jgi:hypothetical protein
MPLAIYHNPQLWFGDKPFPEPTLNLTMTWEALHAVIGSQTFDDINVSIRRNGIFVFDFSNWEMHSQPNEEVARRGEQLKIINTYLLCFYAAVCTRGMIIEFERYSSSMMRADHSIYLEFSPQGLEVQISQMICIG